MHVPFIPLVLFLFVTVGSLAIILPVEWRRIKREYADPNKPRRQPGQLSED